jgi:hypothetical protein
VNQAPPSPQYLVRTGDPLRDRDTVLSIWWGNLGRTDRIAAKYDWFYLGGPHGPPLLQLLQETHSGQWVGTACAGRRRMRHRGRDLGAGVLVDLAVLPEHRSLGPALMLQQGLIDAGREQVDVLYGFPNPKAAAVFKRMGYQHPTDLVRYARVLRHARYLRTRLPVAWLATPAGWLLDMAVAVRDGWRRWHGPRLRAEWGNRADARMDALWNASSQGDGVLAVRDYLHAKWRFDDSPLATTRYLWITARNSGELKAWFAVQVEDSALHVRDFWSDNGAHGLPQAYVLALLSAARAAGHGSVSVEITGPECQLQAWRETGFSERGRRPVFVRWNLANGTEPIWFLTSADEDE